MIETANPLVVPSSPLLNSTYSLVNAVIPTEDGTDSSKPPNNDWVIPTVIFSALLLLAGCTGIGVGGFVLYKKKNNKKQKIHSEIENDKVQLLNVQAAPASPTPSQQALSSSFISPTPSRTSSTERIHSQSGPDIQEPRRNSAGWLGSQSETNIDTAGNSSIEMIHMQSGPDIQEPRNSSAEGFRAQSETNTDIARNSSIEMIHMQSGTNIDGAKNPQDQQETNSIAASSTSEELRNLEIDEVQDSFPPTTTIIKNKRRSLTPMLPASINQWVDPSTVGRKVKRALPPIAAKKNSTSLLPATHQEALDRTVTPLPNAIIDDEDEDRV